MTARSKTALSLVLSLALGGGLLWLSLRDADLAAVGPALAAGEWIWLVPFSLLALASLVLRAWRWGLLIDALPERSGRVSLRLTTVSVTIGYLVNYAAPRLGEVVRAANVSRRAPAPFSAVVGTVVAERVLDVAVLALVLLSVLGLFGDRVRAILADAGATVAGALAATPGWAMALGALAVLMGGVAAVVVVRRGRGRIAEVLGHFRDGFASVLRTGRPGTVVLSTALLWLSYALMTELPFRILRLDELYGVGFVDAWAVMGIGAIGMAIPSPGGTGSYHYATVVALTALCGVAATEAATYALLAHAGALVFYCTLGAAALASQGTSFGAIRREAEAMHS